MTSARLRSAMKALGPGLLFASSAIGTSHLVLSTRAGAHHGMAFAWIILATLALKYPFFEFGPRYASATGFSLVRGYSRQGRWAVLLFLVVIFINMFAVVGAVGAVCAGLLSSMFGLGQIGMPVLVGLVLLSTAGLLVLGRYSVLDSCIKLVSAVLLVTVLVAFVAVLRKGPAAPLFDHGAPGVLHGAGLALLISLMGWMPAGLEASVMSSLWSVEKARVTGYQPSLREGLWDFDLGYAFTVVTALVFLTIGAFTVFGTGERLQGNSVEVSNQLLAVFTTNLGQWSWPVIALAAFGTIYGTLIAAWDGFARSWVEGLRVFRYRELTADARQQQFSGRMYGITLPAIGLGGFLLFFWFSASMMAMLEAATILAFVTAPVIAVLNLRAVTGADIPATHRPASWLIVLAYLGLLFMLGFAGYYVWDLLA